MKPEDVDNLLAKCNVVLAYLDGRITLVQFRLMLGLPVGGA
jgi:hypothetical protein